MRPPTAAVPAALLAAFGPLSAAVGAVTARWARRRWCQVHSSREDPLAGRCFAWLNDPTIPHDPVCHLTWRKSRR